MLDTQSGATFPTTCGLLWCTHCGQWVARRLRALLDRVVGGFDWHVVLNVASGDYCSPVHADLDLPRLRRGFFARLSTALHKLGDLPYAAWWIVRWNRAGYPHMHVLVSGAPSLTRGIVRKCWSDYDGGARVHCGPVHDSAGIIRYTTRWTTEHPRHLPHLYFRRWGSVGGLGGLLAHDVDAERAAVLRGLSGAEWRFCACDAAIAEHDWAAPPEFPF